MDVLQQLAAQGAKIDRLTSDSRRCAPGVAFFAWPGERADGRAHIGDAVARGASAILWEKEGFAWRDEWRIPNLPIEKLKTRASALAHEFYGRPSERLQVFGVTGTNGKTSCSQWIAALMKKTGVIGTLGAGFPGALSPLPNTTPDALELQAFLKDFLSQGAKAVAMEVSSHGLAQARVDGVRFACALFTNLTHDHLDYHGTMAAYGEAKARLFEMPGLGAAVINTDDAFGAALAQRLKVRVIGFGLNAKPQTPEYLFAGPGGEIESSWGRARVTIPVVGRFNVSNALGVLGCLVAAGVPFAQAAGQLAALPPVPGRMQTVGLAPLVVIDYAHTPDALKNVLAALRPVAQERGGRLAVVFGAGGERDAAKRPEMGGLAAQLADQVMVTSDNPRGEDPRAIISQIEQGIPGAHRAEPDRARAIEAVVLEAQDSDVVLIAGKGHEEYQEIAGRRVPFSDAAQARAALGLRTARRKA